METLFVALRVLLSLGAVLALLWLLQRRFARGGVGSTAKARAANSPTVVGRQSVGSKANVVVVEHDGRRFLLGVTEHGVNVLHSSEIEPVPGLDPDLFARELAEAEPADVALVTQSVAPTETAGTSPLAGSILSGETWKQAAAVVRNRR
ncbi:MAG: flagellar biosynthetic protein FliO [Microterricola sp.]